MANRIVYAICSDDCKFETLTKEDILAAIQQAMEQGYVSDPDAAVFSKIKEIHANGTTQIWVGTEAEFNALDNVPSIHKTVVRVGTDGVLYLCTDDSTIHDVVPVEGGGTGATSAAKARESLGITPANIGALSSNGGTVRGSISLKTVDGNGESYFVKNHLATADYGTLLRDVNKDGKRASISINAGANDVYFVDNDGGGFPILTTKKTVTVPQGGTGATNAAQACANIGALPTTGGQVDGSINIVRNDTNGAALHMKRTKDGTEADLALTIAGDLTARFSYIHSGEERNYLLFKGGGTVLGKPLSIESGGTGATNATQARKNLGFTYSTTEQATGDTWIDGKPIYRVVIETGAKTSNNQYYDLTAFNIEKYISLRGMLYPTNYGDGDVFPIPFAAPMDSAYFVMLQAKSRTRVEIGTNAIVWNSGFIVIEFTKTTD